MMELGAGRKDKALTWSKFLPFLGIQMGGKWGRLSFSRVDDKPEYFIHRLTEKAVYFPEPVPSGPTQSC